MEIKESIADQETLLLEFVKGRIVRSIQQFLQWKLFSDIYEEQEKKEREKLTEHEEEVTRWLKKHTPIHYQHLRFNPLCMVSNDCNWLYYQNEYANWNSQASSMMPEVYQEIITYKDFKEAGFSQGFTKRVLDKYISLGVISRTRHTCGCSYGWTDISTLEPFFHPSRKSVELGQFGLHARTDMDWLFDKYSDQELEEKYKEIHLEAISKLNKKKNEGRASHEQRRTMG